jgi:GntR family transcriptional repressor for pyruvate dehydrogenase complex
LRELSHAFHISVVNASQNDILISVYKGLFQLLNMSKHYTINVSGISYNSILAHETIMNRITARDCEGARACMLEHMLATKEKLFEILKRE